MGEISDIGWCDGTFNGWIGCTKHSQGCAKCYAEQLMQNQYKKAVWGPLAPRVKTSEFYWKQPKRWNDQRYFECMQCGYRGVWKDPNQHCLECGHPLTAVATHTRRRIFAHSLSDILEPRKELAPWRAEEIAIWRNTPNLDWIVLTKYIEYLDQLLPGFEWPANVAMGVSCEDQRNYNYRWPKLQASGAKVEFLSVEPMLSPVNLLSQDVSGLDWVICGAESGDERRPFDDAAAVDLYRQCKELGIKFFTKQGSAFKPGQQGKIPDWLWKIKEFPKIGAI